MKGGGCGGKTKKKKAPTGFSYKENRVEGLEGVESTQSKAPDFGVEQGGQAKKKKNESYRNLGERGVARELEMKSLRAGVKEKNNEEIVQ